MEGICQTSTKVYRFKHVTQQANVHTIQKWILFQEYILVKIHSAVPNNIFDFRIFRVGGIFKYNECRCHPIVLLYISNFVNFYFCLFHKSSLVKSLGRKETRVTK